MTDPQLTIRQADPATHEVAGDLLRRFFAEEGLDTTPNRQSRGLSELLGDLRHCAVLVAWLADEAVGIVTVSWNPSVEYVRAATLNDLYVVPAARGRHVATTLVEAAATWAADHGCSALFVGVGPEGELSHGVTGFFTARGFADEYRKLLSLALQPRTIDPQAATKPPATPSSEETT